MDLRFRTLKTLALAAALATVPALCLAYEEQSVLTADGTMHLVRSGTAVELGIGSAAADSYMIEWSSKAQDGTVQMAVIPGTVSSQEKRGLQLAYDESTGKLLLLWIEEISAYSHVRVGVLQNGAWTNSALMPTQGLSRAFNPQMQLTHQTVTFLDDKNATVSQTASILSVIWWEESNAVLARFASVFLDEDSRDPGSIDVYEMPALIGSKSVLDAGDVPSGAYLYPALQSDGLSGVLLASFADLFDLKEKVVHVSYPSDRGKPSETGNIKWERRHAPIVSIALTGPVARMVPILAHQTDPTSGVTTIIGAGYRPTLSWRDGDSLKYSRLDGADWSPVRSIAIDDTMTYEMARALVIAMGQRN